MKEPFLPEDLRNRPTLEEFIAVVRAEFEFLTSEFEFAEEPLPSLPRQNEFQVRFISPKCRIIIEGINWGGNIHILFERLAGGRAQLFDLVGMRDPALTEPFRHSGDQRVLLRLAASLIRQHAMNAVHGEPDIFRAAEVYHQRKVQEQIQKNKT